jgi:hypothetical protein
MIETQQNHQFFAKASTEAAALLCCGKLGWGNLKAGMPGPNHESLF